MIQVEWWQLAVLLAASAAGCFAGLAVLALITALLLRSGDNADMESCDGCGFAGVVGRNCRYCNRLVGEDADDDAAEKAMRS